MDHKKNNFDFLRLIFAASVLVTHAYTLSGSKECDWLCQLTNGQVVFSYLGVKGFFVISGYLIFQSLERSRNLVDYYWKRLLRLFPALFIVLLLTTFLVPIVYEGSVPYYLNKSLFTYLPKNLTLFHLQYNIEGVFEKNPYQATINGSLWTIQYEFTLYILLSFLIIFKRRKKVLIAILSGLMLFFWVGNRFYFNEFKQFTYIINGELLLDLGIFFIAGSLMAALNIEKINRKWELILLVVIVIIASFYYNFFNASSYFTLPILFILVGLNPIPIIENIGNKIGDLSYGIYIYGFPVQQTLMHFYKLNYLELMIYSLFISAIFAFFSWHLVEKKMLKFKKYTQYSP